MPIVVDCSVAAAWALVDEQTAWISAALTSATSQGVIVPSLFWFEVRNILIVNERRGRIDANQIARFLGDVDTLTVADLRPDGNSVLAFARTHSLTVYDASYLELASRLQLPICTLDKQLVEAAPRARVALWQP